MTGAHIHSLGEVKEEHEENREQAAGPAAGADAGLRRSAETPDGTPESHTVEGVTYPYLRQLSAEEEDPTESEMTLYLVDGGDIPYVALSEYMTFLSGLLKDLGKGDIAYEIITAGEDDLYHFEATRTDNGSIMFVFPERDQLMFSNLNTFTQSVGTKILVSARDMPEVETISPIDLAELLIAEANLDAEDQALA